MPRTSSVTYLTLPNGKGHGWRKDRPSIHHLGLEDRLGPAATAATPQVARVGLDRAHYPRMRDQDQLGSCTGHGLRNALAYRARRILGEKLAGEWGKGWDLSPLGMYFFGREAENAIASDAGCEIHDVVMAARRRGIPTEAAWPYKNWRADFRRRPSQAALKTAAWHRAGPASFRCDRGVTTRQQIVDRIIKALQADLPVPFGFVCYSNLDDPDVAATGRIPLPSGDVTGGHCMCIYEADLQSRVFIGPNSWGDWGATLDIPGRGREMGYFILPFDYFLLGQADDAWAVDLEHREPAAAKAAA